MSRTARTQAIVASSSGWPTLLRLFSANAGQRGAARRLVDVMAVDAIGRLVRAQNAAITRIGQAIAIRAGYA